MSASTNQTVVGQWTSGSADTDTLAGLDTTATLSPLLFHTSTRRSASGVLVCVALTPQKESGSVSKRMLNQSSCWPSVGSTMMSSCWPSAGSTMHTTLTLALLGTAENWP